MLAAFCQILFVPMLAMVFLYFFMARVLPIRKGWLWRGSVIMAVMGLFGLVKLVFGMFSPQGHAVRLLAFPFAFIVAPLWLFEGPVWRRLVVNMLFYCCQLLGEAVWVQFFIPVDMAGQADAFYNQMGSAFLLLYGAATQSTSIILYCAAVVFARTLSARRFLPVYLPVFCIPLCLWGMLMGHYLNLPSWSWFLCILLGSGSVMVLLYYITSLEEKDTLKEQVRELRHTMELEQAHYRTVEERREELARIRHDFNNHLSAIGRLMDDGEVHDAQRMIALLRKNISATRETPYCSIPVVNAVLEEKAQVCQEKRVVLRAVLEFPEDLTVEPLHLCSIFSNLMDNAIRGAAASGKERPEISLTARCSGDYLFIRVENPIDSPTAREQVPSGRGLGLRICQEIAGRYEGSCHNIQKDGVYTALVSLLARKEISGLEGP